MDWLVTLVDTIGVEATIAIFVFLIVGIFAAAVYLIAKRGVKDAEIISQTVAHQQRQIDELDEDVTENTAERWRLIGERIQAEENLKRCQEKLEERGASSMTLAEEKALRDMIIRQQEEIRALNGQLALLKNNNDIRKDESQ
jgi:regulatory protein YycI of two-component signal transduction system YycFG